MDGWEFNIKCSLSQKLTQNAKVSLSKSVSQILQLRSVVSKLTQKCSKRSLKSDLATISFKMFVDYGISALVEVLMLCDSRALNA